MNYSKKVACNKYDKPIVNESSLLAKIYKMKYFLTSIFSLIFIGFSFGQDYNPEKLGMTNKDLPQGLKVGDKAPNFQLKDVNDSVYDLYEALKSGPVVMNFYRGNWCPYCTRYLASLNDSVSQIIDLGASYIAISPENPSEIKKSAEGLNSHIKILNDSKAIAMKAYDVDFYVTDNYKERVERKIKKPAEEFYDQEDLIFPVPATYIINKEGIIIYKFFDPHYSQRASVLSILNALNSKKIRK